MALPTNKKRRKKMHLSLVKNTFLLDQGDDPCDNKNNKEGR